MITKEGYNHFQDWLNNITKKNPKIAELLNKYAYKAFFDCCERYDGRIPFLPYLKQQLKYAELQALRETKRRVSGKPMGSREHDHTKIIEVKDLMDNLTRQEKDILDALYWKDMKVIEVAKEYGENERTIRRYRDKALEKCR